MGSGVSSGTSRQKLTSQNHETEVEPGQDAYSYHFANEGIKFNQTPLAYRDTDGKIKIYSQGAAPTILVPDDDTTECTDGKGTEEDDGKTSPIHSDADSTDSRFASPDFDCPKVPVLKRRDLLPDEDVIRLIDEHSWRAPPDIREDFFKLVDYLTEVTCTPLEHVRAFYIWITHNINFDTSGFFGRCDLMPTDPTSVLKNRMTVCRGYTELMEEFCRLANIPVKTIHGYVKPYGYQAETTDVSLDRFSAHAWNAVFIKNEWRLLDVTLGSGFAKPREGTYVPRFNDVYFLTDPGVFVTDHYPSMEGDSTYSEKWQLLEEPLDMKGFSEILNMDKHGKEWGIETISHKTAVIHDVQYELDIIIAETSTRLSDYVVFMFIDDKKIPHYTYVYKFEENRVNIHARFPVVGKIVLRLYGQRVDADRTADLEPLLKYTIIVTKSFEMITPYPLTYTPYGAVEDLKLFGISSVGNFHHITKSGEATVSVTPLEDVDLIPRLQYGDHKEDLKRFVFMNYSEDFENILFHIKIPFIGNFKLTLFGKKGDTFNACSSFMTCLLENIETVSDDLFPVALTHSIKFKCCLVAPLTKEVPANSEILFHVKSQFLATVKVGETVLVRTDEQTFSGKINSPGPCEDLKMYGAEELGGAYRPLYQFNTN